jgi:hypothetical protein
MSTGCNCLVVEPQQGKWYYVLEDYNAPKNASNWLDYAKAYGPFPSEEAAVRHLSDNHANPGGWWTERHDEYRPSKTLDGLLKRAAANMKSSLAW